MYRIVTYENAINAPIAGLAELGRLESPYAKYGFKHEVIYELMEKGTAFVLFHNDTPVGFLGAIVNEAGPILKGIKVATEIFWYVAPKHRGSGEALKLITSYEAWGKAKGCKLATMCNMRNQYMERLSGVYERLGYHKAEETYLKELS